MSALALLLFGSGCATAEQPVRQSAQHQSIAPCFTGTPAPTQGGLPSITLPCKGPGGPESVNMAHLAGSTPIVISLWASYCSSCREELSALDAYRRASHGSIRVLTVLTNDRESSAALITDISAQLPVIYDKSGRLLTALKVAHALPVNVILRANGTVAQVYQGPPKTSEADFAQLVAHALNKN
jgi:peroxiredoxin